MHKINIAQMIQDQKDVELVQKGLKVKYRHFFDRDHVNRGGLCIAVTDVIKATERYDGGMRYFGVSLCAAGDNYCKDLARYHAVKRLINKEFAMYTKGNAQSSISEFLDEAPDNLVEWRFANEFDPLTPKDFKRMKDFFHHFYK